jgi:hypothetical protein
MVWRKCATQWPLPDKLRNREAARKRAAEEKGELNKSDLPTFCQGLYEETAGVSRRQAVQCMSDGLFREVRTSGSI